MVARLVATLIILITILKYYSYVPGVGTETGKTGCEFIMQRARALHGDC